MIKEELAALMNGRQYGDEITASEEKLAREHGLIVAFGASDDLAEFRGAANTEFSVYEGGEFMVNTDGEFPYAQMEKILNCHEIDRKKCPCARLYFKALEKLPMASVDFEWCKPDTGFSWFVTANVPFAPFEILDGNDKYCRGIVINKADIAAINKEAKAS